MTEEPRSDELKRKQKLLEFMVTVGGFLGIIIAIKPLDGTTGSLFSIFLVGFVLSSLFAYTSLTSDRDWAGYPITIGLLSLSFLRVNYTGLCLAVGASIGVVWDEPKHYYLRLWDSGFRPVYSAATIRFVQSQCEAQQANYEPLACIDSRAPKRHV